MSIEPLKSLVKLEVLGAFHNEIYSEQRTLEVIQSLPKLTELSIEGNPCSLKMSFKYQLIMNLPNLKILDEDSI